jgi:hypothetical protein
MSKNYDKIFKENFEALYLSLSELVLNYRPVKISDVKLDIHRTIERLPDFLKKVRNPKMQEEFLLHLEIQTTDDREMLYRMHEYHSLLFRKFKLRIEQIVIYTGEGKSKMSNFYEDDAYKISYKLFSLQDISYKTFLESDKPEELLLTVLANFEQLKPEIIIEKILTRAQMITNETFSLEKFVSQFEVISKLRNLDQLFKTIIDKIMPLEINIEELYLFKKGELKGEKKGLKKGELKIKIKTVKALIKIGKLSKEEIAFAAGVALAFVEDIISKNIHK